MIGGAIFKKGAFSFAVDLLLIIAAGIFLFIVAKNIWGAFGK
jgi:hypothetical protein